MHAYFAPAINYDGGKYGNTKFGRKFSSTEFSISTATATTINHKLSMNKGIDHVVVVVF